MRAPGVRAITAGRALAILFLGSGFASLLLEMTWARQLSLLTGTGVRSAGAVVALTLGGLAAGAALTGLLADRIRRPLRAYALAEGAVALWALATPSLLPLLSRLLPELAEQGGSARLDLPWRVVLVISLLVLPAALLMGATTPLVVRSYSLMSAPDHPREGAARSLSRLYGWNTAGGAAGAWATAFAIFPHLGLRATLLLAAGIDLGVVLGATWLDRRVPPQAPRPKDLGTPEIARDRSAARKGRALAVGALFVVGALSASCQVAWTRLLVLYFGSSVQALGLTLSVCLVGLALGSLLMTRPLSGGFSRRKWEVGLCALAAGSLLLSFMAWGRLPVLIVLIQARLGASFATGLALQALLCSILVLPTAAAFGALLPTLVASLGNLPDGQGRTSASGYALDSAGSVLGGLLTVYVLLPRLGAEGILRSVILAASALASLFVVVRTARPLRARAAPLAALGILGAAGLLAPRWDPSLLTSGPLLYGTAYARAGGLTGSGIREAIRHRGDLLFFDEGADATVTVRQGRTGGRSLQINGKTDASDSGDLPAQILAGRIPSLLHGAPKRALVIGLATGTTAASVAVDTLDRLDCVEISPGVARAARFFESVHGGVLSDKRFHIFLGDGRIFLQQRPNSYDLIVSQPTNPWIAGVTNLFTREFFLSMRARLAPGGVALVWVQGYAMAPGDFKSVVGTFHDVFPEAQLWEESAGGGDYYLVARREHARQPLSRLAAGWHEAPYLRKAGEVVSELPDLLERFLASGTVLKDFAREAPRITDDNLRLEYSAPREIWRNRLPELLASLEAIRQPPASAFPDLAEPAHRLLREELARRERGRRDRIRIALALRSEDLEALGSPALAGGVSLILAGRSAQALPFLTRALAEAPHAPVVPLLQGWTLLGEGRPEEAEAAFRSARALDPHASDALKGLGLALYRLGKLEEAARSFQDAIRRDANDPDLLSNLGAVRLAEGRLEEALDLLDRALRKDPAHVSARINRGVALARLGRVEEAILEYRAVLEKDPDNEDARYNLARALERLARPHGGDETK